MWSSDVAELRSTGFTTEILTRNRTPRKDFNGENLLIWLGSFVSVLRGKQGPHHS